MVDVTLRGIMVESMRLEPLSGGFKSWTAPLRAHFKVLGIDVLRHDEMIQEFEVVREAFRKYRTAADILSMRYVIDVEMKHDVNGVVYARWSFTTLAGGDLMPDYAVPIMHYVYHGSVPQRPFNGSRIALPVKAAGGGNFIYAIDLEG